MVGVAQFGPLQTLAVKISFRLSENFEKPKAKGIQETKNERNERKQIK